MSALPREINYADRLAALPANTNCISVVNSPSNGQQFADGGSLIYFDLGARGFLVPGSMYLRYKCTVANATTTAGVMKGTPIYTPFAKCETIIGSSVCETISTGFGQLANIVINTKLNYAQKAGLAYGLGYIDSGSATGATPTFDNLNGRTIPAAGESWFMGAPIPNILSNSEKLVPLCMMPAVRIQLTTDALANMFTTTTQIGMALTNMELCYDIIEFGSEVESLVHSMADESGDIYIKSQSFVSSTQTITNGTSGTIELVYNQRLSSIKGLIANFGGNTGNTFYDSKDVTSRSGDYQFVVAGQAYPQRPISMYSNKTGALNELMSVWGPSHSIQANNFSITPSEFNQYVSGSTPTALIPAKNYIGTNVEKLSTNNALLTGISSQLSPISLRINFGAATTAETHTATLICLYDAIIQVNVPSRQCSVKQ